MINDPEVQHTSTGFSHQNPVQGIRRIREIPTQQLQDTENNGFGNGNPTATTTTMTTDD
jgi:hypothetical protein